MSNSILHDIYDPDSTFDILWADRMYGKVQNLLFRALGNHFPIVEMGWGTHLILIERFTPDKYPWAWQWSTKFYEFIRKLSRTWLIDNAEIVGTAYGFDMPHAINFPNNIMVDEGMPDRVTLKVAPGATVTINWLQKNHNKPTNRLNLFTDRECLVYEKVYRKIANPSLTEDFFVEYYTVGWLINSVVIDGDGLLVGLTDAEKQWCMYDFLDTNLDLIYGQLQIPTIKVLTGCICKITAFANLTWQIFPQGAIPSIRWQEVFKPQEKFESPLYQNLPTDYNYAAIYYAENNYWASPNVSNQDKSFGVDFYAGDMMGMGRGYRLNHFNKWSESYQPPYSDGDLMFNNLNGRVIEIDASHYFQHLGKTAKFYSSELDYKPTENSETIANYPFSVNRAYSYSHTHFPHPSLNTTNGGEFLLKSDFYWDVPNRIDPVALYNTIGYAEYQNTNWLPTNNFSGKRDRFYIKNMRRDQVMARNSNGEPAMRHFFEIRTNVTSQNSMIEIPFTGNSDYRLFSGGEVALVRCCITGLEVLTDTEIEWNGHVDLSQHNFNHENKIFHEDIVYKFFLSYDDYDNFSVTKNVIKNNINLMENNVVDLDYQTHNFNFTFSYSFVTAETAFPLSRSLRVNGLDDWYGEQGTVANGNTVTVTTPKYVVSNKVKEFHQWQGQFDDLQPVYLRIDEEFIDEPIPLEFGYLYVVQTEGLNFTMPRSWSVGQSFGIQLKEGISRVTTNDYPEEITGFIEGLPAFDAVHLFYYDGDNVIYQIGDY